jgi:hypothetical protein
MKRRTTILHICIATLIVTGLSLGVGRAQSPSPTKSSTLSEKDKSFMRKAAKGGMMEVAMGRVAEQNAQSGDVKSFICQVRSPVRNGAQIRLT